MTEHQRLSDLYWEGQPGPWKAGVLGFQRSIDVNGPWAVAIALSQSHPRDLTAWRGVAYVYERVDGGWQLGQILAHPFLSTAYGFDTPLVNGEELLISDPGENRVGRIHAFRLVGGHWVYAQTIECPYPGFLDGFGGSKYVLGDELYVRSNGRGMGSASNGRGTIYRFVRQGADWVYSGDELYVPVGSGVRTAPGGIVISGDVLVGSSIEESTGRNCVVVFRRQNGVWAYDTYLVRPTIVPGARDRFGAGGLDVQNGWLAVGDTLDYPLPIPQAGRVYMYRDDPLAPNGWTLVQTLEASNAYYSTQYQSSDWFGGDLELDGSRMLVTARHSYSGPQQSIFNGQAYLFELAGGLWHETRRISSSRLEAGVPPFTAVFGEVCALDGGTALVTDWTEGHPALPAGHNYGALYVYELPLGTTYCAPAAGPGLEVTGVAEAARGALTARLHDAPGAGLGIVFASEVAQGAPLPAANGLGLCVGGPALRVATFLTGASPGARVDVAATLARPAAPVTVGARWSYQAVVLAQGAREMTPAVAVTME